MLIATQDKFAQMVENFHFNLGFSGKYFRLGTDDENEADDLLIGKKMGLCDLLTLLLLWL